MNLQALEWSICDDSFQFRWNLHEDLATVHRAGQANPIWSGGLLPLFEVAGPQGGRSGIPALIRAEHCTLGKDQALIALSLAGYGEGELHVSAAGGCIRFEKLVVRWDSVPPRLIAVHWGAKLLTAEQSEIVPDLSRPFWPSWQSEGYCIPSVKGGPVQSFFRRWDLGHATLPLGSFGPSLGTPYAAAFPRPLFSAAMGNLEGWVAIGCGEVPEGAMLLQIRSSTASLEYRYREDLWSPPDSGQRTWNQPLRLTWAEAAWDAYDRLFATFGPVEAAGEEHQMAIWNTWGDFRHRHFDLRAMIDTAARHLHTQLFCIDDYWETFNSSGVPDLERFPHFHQDLAYARQLGMEIGFWQASGWIAQPEAVGLGEEDLLLGHDGRPRRANWSFNPHEAGGRRPFCLDPSSPRSRQFLKQRTAAVVGELGAMLLKIDFAYGLPGPDVGAPRNPELRGERMGFALLKTIADAARQANPTITLEGFSIHPLMRPVTDLLSLDDLGDAGGQLEGRYEVQGHAQWCIWAALAGRYGTAINASCGYNETAEPEIMLNTAIVGAPGIILAMSAYDDSPEGVARRCRGWALARWHRRTTRWRPLWLDSEKGRLGLEPSLACWGRLDALGGQVVLPALALRDSGLKQTPPTHLGIAGWSGRWALIAQEEGAIHQSACLACIPIDAGWVHLQLEQAPTAVRVVTLAGERPAEEATIEGTRVRIEVPANSREPIVGYLVVREI
jgi:hypothetical protein